jgi:Protein of unknown function (DUF3800)
MFVCYVDESGCMGTLPSANSEIQPVFVIAGVAVPQQNLSSLTNDFLDWKAKFFPRLASSYRYRFDLLLNETKGSEVRKSAVSANRRERRHAIGLLDHLLRLLEHHHAKIMGRVWVKGIGLEVNATAVYTSSMQSICQTFQNLLERNDDMGIVIADSRTKVQNARVSHSIFTQKFKSSGDQYGRILEMPVFGHSENHVGIQIADLLSSGLIFPMAVHAYCLGAINSGHVKPGYSLLRSTFGLRLKALQHRFADGIRSCGGLTVSDSLRKRHGGLLFRVDQPLSPITITDAKPAVPIPDLAISNLRSSQKSALADLNQIRDPN